MKYYLVLRDLNTGTTSIMTEHSIYNVYNAIKDNLALDTVYDTLFIKNSFKTDPTAFIPDVNREFKTTSHGSKVVSIDTITLNKLL